MQEQGRSRYVKYVFPFVDCAIKYYVRMRRPVRMSDIIRCMREGYKDKFSIKSVGKVYRIKDSAKEYCWLILEFCFMLVLFSVVSLLFSLVRVVGSSACRGCTRFH